MRCNHDSSYSSVVPSAEPLAAMALPEMPLRVCMRPTSHQKQPTCHIRLIVIRLIVIRLKVIRLIVCMRPTSHQKQPTCHDDHGDWLDEK